jgi:NADH-quinone oxidoreductase subunit M
MYFLIGIWGGPRREYASIKFFLYTLLGSILILIVVIALYISVKDPNSAPNTITHSFNMIDMRNPSNFIEGSLLHHTTGWTIGPFSARLWAFLLLFVGFAIKLPMVPLHTWLPDAHVEAPTPVSVLLAALLLKIGGYGLLRLAYPVFPDGAVYFSWFVGLFGVISIIYGAMNALASKDLKRLIAYSSVSHMGFVLLGIASSTVEGVSGAVYQMFSHGIISAMLFLLAGVLSDRTHDRLIENYSGLSGKMPIYTGFIVVAFFASLGLPGFSGFIAEILTLLGAFNSSGINHLVPVWMASVATSGLLLSATYYLWTIQRMFYGKFNYKGDSTIVLNDLDRREYSTLLPLALLALCFGIFPQLLLDFINPFAEQFVNVLSNSGMLNP